MILTFSNVMTAMEGGTKVRDYGTDHLADIARTVLQEAYTLAGREPQLDFSSRELAKDMAGSYGHLTVAEIRLAAKAGVVGEFGGVKTPSFAAMISWLDSYDKSPMVADVRKAIAARGKAPRKVTPEEGLQMMRRTMPQCARSRWEDIRINGSFAGNKFPHVSAQVYDWLQESGILQVAPDMKRAAWARARRDMAGMMASVISSLESPEEVEVRLAKHLTLEAWMRDLHKAGATFNIPQTVTRIYE